MGKMIFFVILKTYKLVISLLSVILPDMGFLQRIFIHNTKSEMGQVEDIVSNVKYYNLSQAWISIKDSNRFRAICKDSMEILWKKISKGYYRNIKQSHLGLNGQDKNLGINKHILRWYYVRANKLSSHKLRIQKIITYSPEQQKMKGFNMLWAST